MTEQVLEFLHALLSTCLHTWKIRYRKPLSWFKMLDLFLSDVQHYFANGLITWIKHSLSIRCENGQHTFRQWIRCLKRSIWFWCIGMGRNECNHLHTRMASSRFSNSWTHWASLDVFSKVFVDWKPTIRTTWRFCYKGWIKVVMNWSRFTKENFAAVGAQDLVTF